MFKIKLVEKIKKSFLSNSLLFENHAFYELLWKSIAEQGRP
jgi:hypothetical protein